MRTQRRVGQVAAQRLVLIARQTAHADLHRPRRAREIRDARTSRPRLRRAGRIRQAALIAFLLTDPGQYLPRDLELSPDLLVDPQEAGWDVADRQRRGRVTDAAAGASPAHHDRQQRRPAGEQQREAGRDHDEHADAAPAGHDRHRSSPLLHIAHQPPAAVFPERKPQPIRRDPSVLDARRREHEPWGSYRALAATQPADGGGARPA